MLFDAAAQSLNEVNPQLSSNRLGAAIGETTLAQRLVSRFAGRFGEVIVVPRAEQSLVVGELARLEYRPWELTIHTLRQCIGERRRVRLLYRSLSRQEDTERALDPYALTFQWGLWYLVGYCHLRGDLRTFRVDRMQEAAPLEDRFTIPRDFSLQDYLARTMRYEPQYM